MITSSLGKNLDYYMSISRKSSYGSICCLGSGFGSRRLIIGAIILPHALIISLSNKKPSHLSLSSPAPFMHSACLSVSLRQDSDSPHAFVHCLMQDLYIIFFSPAWSNSIMRNRVRPLLYMASEASSKKMIQDFIGEFCRRVFQILDLG